MEMRKHVVSEIQRRFDVMKENTSLSKTGVRFGHTGSRIRFDSGLALIGYPFAREEWMDDEYIKPVMSEEEYNANVYGPFVEKLFGQI